MKLRNTAAKIFCLKRIVNKAVLERSYFCACMKKAFIQLHIAVFLAGFTAILGKLITLNEGILVWYRLLITALTLVVLLYFRKELQRLSLKAALKLFGVGAIVALHWVTFYGSIKYSNVSVSLTCLSAIGFFTAFLDPLIMRRRIDIMEIFLGLLAIAGIYLIFDFYPEYKLGILFGIISALLASLFPIFNKNLLKQFSAKTLTLYEMCGGLIALTFILPFYLQLFPATYYLPTVNDWLWLLVLAWLCTVFTFILALNALKKISPFTANLAYNLEPVYGIILAFIIFKENKYLSAGFYYGLGLILLAVALQMLRVVLKASRDKRSTKKVLPG
ncbi:MAG TPA: EamA family transporter [Chitinophagaceae bacterium]|nr:EamA family transporter [Chitinophagaceae bacterium]